ncbi:ImmA/IrrE family metallo-endopeptidase [Actinacidiphila acidipaludis]|uniref:IrrE N-terminal-like domain-containing protein n=1 Tax=Actinacidiphila acidipaludis TaxID=2873382 RepID=A0ABS7QHI5_9ACTN|nr:ImmA/IrrE family metallo-endopeptidase [Streptomyces acidipaludis]MBY8882639.1 hypothetical protein [Streptomyces acidipaludis]
MADPDASPDPPPSAGVLIDGDSHLELLGPWASPDVPPYAATAFTAAERRRIHLLHYLLRGNFVLTVAADDEDVAAFMDGSRRCLDLAAHYVRDDGALPVPDWLEATDAGIKDILRPDHPAVDDVRITVTWDQRIYARSRPRSREILVSAVTRAHLRSLNVWFWTSWNHAMRAADPKDTGKLATIRAMLRNSEGFTLPLLAFLVSVYRDIDLSRLPCPRAWDAESFRLASLWTAMQTTFVLAHEYAHVLLHGDHPLGSPRLEAEADAFAYRVLLAFDRTGFTPDGVRPALRWYFRLLAIERSVGQVINSHPVDWIQEDIQCRPLAFLHPTVGDPNAAYFDAAVGNAAMVAKHFLREAGPERIREYSKDICAEFGTLARPTHDRRAE